MSNKILKGVAGYYTEKLNRFGNTSLGVDWNSKESQYLRFEQLSKVIAVDEDFSVLDYGCGFAEFVNFLENRFSSFKYSGFDISEKMIEQAEKLFAGKKNVSLTTSIPENKCDYVIASGIFNVKLDLADNKEWKEYILSTLHSMNNLSEKGFSFNALTSYSDKEYMKDYLFYLDPLFIFDYCKRNFSRNVALLHDYNLYEFTIIVRK